MVNYNIPSPMKKEKIRTWASIDKNDVSWDSCKSGALKMKYAKRYREFERGKNTLPSVKDNVSNRPIDKKEEVLAYLKKDTYVIAASPGISYDLFSGDHISREYLQYSDGVFTWDYRDVYYFEKYNLDLGAEFIKYILEKIK